MQNNGRMLRSSELHTASQRLLRASGSVDGKSRDENHRNTWWRIHVFSTTQGRSRIEHPCAVCADLHAAIWWARWQSLWRV